VLPLNKEGHLLNPSEREEGGLMVTWDAVYKIAELLIQTGVLVCAIITLVHMMKKK
jgi:hypothetical protein